MHTQIKVSGARMACAPSHTLCCKYNPATHPGSACACVCACVRACVCVCVCVCHTPTCALPHIHRQHALSIVRIHSVAHKRRTTATVLADSCVYVHTANTGLVGGGGVCGWHLVTKRDLCSAKKGAHTRACAHNNEMYAVSVEGTSLRSATCVTDTQAQDTH